MTAVVLLGELTSLPLFPECGSVPRAFDPGPAGPGAPALVELVADELAAHGTVLLLHLAWDGGHGGHLARIARAALGSSRLVPVETSLPPLATSVLATQLAAVAAHVPEPGQLPAGAAWLAARLTVGAWVSGVGGLEHPSPSLGQHLWSWWPRSRFAVALQPEPGVQRIRRRRPYDAARWALPAPSVAVMAVRGGDVTWVHEHVLPAIAAGRLVEAAPSPRTRAWWGAPRVVEVVGCPADPAASARQLAADHPCVPCGWCGAPVPGASCPFCQVAQTPLPTVRSVA